MKIKVKFFYFFIILILSSSNLLWGDSYIDKDQQKVDYPDLKNLKEIILDDGLDVYQTEAVLGALSYEIKNIFDFYLNNRFYDGVYNLKATRQNLSFGIVFKAQTMDFNNDLINDVIVQIEHPDFCGSGGCNDYILINKKEGWKKIAKLRAHKFFVSNSSESSALYYAKCKTNNIKDCDFYWFGHIE